MRVLIKHCWERGEYLSSEFYKFAQLVLYVDQGFPGSSSKYSFYGLHRRWSEYHSSNGFITPLSGSDVIIKPLSNSWPEHISFPSTGLRRCWNLLGNPVNNCCFHSIESSCYFFKGRRIFTITVINKLPLIGLRSSCYNQQVLGGNPGKCRKRGISAHKQCFLSFGDFLQPPF